MRGGPSIKHLDDVPAEEMLRYQFAEGHTASIWEKWIELSPRYVAFWNKWDPGEMSALHVVCGPGTHIMLEWGDLFGPWEAGPEGCELYGFIAGEGSPFSGDPETFQALLDERGAHMVPLPLPTRLPPWVMSKFTQGNVVNWTTDEPSDET